MDTLYCMLSSTHQKKMLHLPPVVRPIPLYSEDMDIWEDMDGEEWIEIREGEWLKKEDYWKFREKLCLKAGGEVSNRTFTIAGIMANDRL